MCQTVTLLVILTRAEVPHDLEIVPLPPDLFYNKNKLFLFDIFQYIKQNLIAFFTNMGRQMLKEKVLPVYRMQSVKFIDLCFADAK